MGTTMRPIIKYTLPTPEFKCAKIIIEAEGVDEKLAPKFMATYQNADGQNIDRRPYEMDESDWQNWLAAGGKTKAEKIAEDKTYVANKILAKASLEVDTSKSEDDAPKGNGKGEGKELEVGGK